MGRKCTNCRSDNTITGPRVDEGNYYYKRCECLICNNRWLIGDLYDIPHKIIQWRGIK